MADYTPEHDSVVIVLIGSFNPAIFQPSWFGAKGLLPERSVEGAQLTVVHPELSTFSTDWLNLQVTRHRFAAETADPSCIALLRDLVVGIFQLLEHTPLDRLGINRLFHYKVSDEARWHAFGHRVAPKDLWESVIPEPGLQSLAMQARREDGLQGWTNVKVEPSKKVTPYGVFFEINNDIAAGDDDQSESFVEIVANHSDRMLLESAKIAEHLLKEGGL